MTDVADARDKRWIALALLCVAQFVVVLDASIVNVALPTIKEALNFSEDSLPWVLNADIAWSYAYPSSQVLQVAGLIAFYDEKVDTFLNDVPVHRPRTKFSEDDS